MEAERVKHRGGCITQSTLGRVLNASFRGWDFVLGAGEPGEGWEQGGNRVCSGGLRGTQAMERLGAFGQGVCVWPVHVSIFSGRKRARDVSWDAGSSRGSGGAPGTCGAGGSEARGEALRVDERGRQTAGLGGGHTDPFCLRAFFVFCIFLN